MRFNQLVPELSVSDIENSKRFYTDVLRFRIEIDHVEEFVARIKEKGVVPFKDIFTSKYRCDGVSYVEKEVLIQDPDGYLLRFSETLEEE